MRLAFFLSLLMTVVMSTLAQPDDRASLDEAKAMAQRAAAHYRQAGEAAALSDFMKLPDWRDRDLYVFAVKVDGLMLANAANPVLVGRNLGELRDVDGKQIQPMLVAIKDAGWVEYRWRNPKTDGIEWKSTYAIRVSDSLIIGVGAYKK
jgi:signal transduction histidine kinase